MASYDEALKQAIEYFNGDEMAAEVYLGKYALTTPEGDILEPTPQEMHQRLAREFARIEKKYPNPLSEKKIFNYLDGFKYIIPQGSPMAGIGNPYQIMSLGNCYTIESPWDSYAGILKTDQEQAQLMKRRAGVGFDISNIRPKGVLTANAAKSTDGIGLFMERFSNTCREVAQGGRRGALMQTISVHHPEIDTFINIKRDRKKVTGANISIRLTDEFMEAVKADKEYQQRWPVDNKKNPPVSQMASAKKVWDSIIDSAHDCAEPGLLFWDTCLRYTPSDAYTSKGMGSISCNPCLSADTWIMTKDGARQVSDLLDDSFVCVNDGKTHKATRFFKTGKKNVYTVQTHQGYELKGTIDHKILVKNKGWTKIGDLQKGDAIILHNHDDFQWKGGEGTLEEGWLLGEMVGDGCFNPKKYPGLVAFWGDTRNSLSAIAEQRVRGLNYKFRSDFKGGLVESVGAEKISLVSGALDKLARRFITPGEKNLLPAVEKASYDFYVGFLRGLFDADGSVQGNAVKGISVRLAQNNLTRLKAVQRMLLRMGIYSKIYSARKQAGFYLMPNGLGGQSKYFCKAMHELCISRNMINRFYEKIGFEDQKKQQRLELFIESRKRTPYQTQFVATFEELKKSTNRQDVYDCEVPDVHYFDANGIKTHNCSEILLSANDSCRLMVVNAFSFVKDPFTKSAKLNFEKLAEVSGVAQRLMDDLVDLELECIQKIINKIVADPEPKEVKAIELNLWKKIYVSCENGRRTGLGITGIADSLAGLGVRYGSPESIEITKEIYKALALGAYGSSVQMADERGSFPLYEYKLEEKHPFINRIMDLDPKLRADWKKFGRRNIALTTTAPCGSISVLAQTSSGIEPVYSLAYTRRRKINPSDKNARVDFVDDSGDKWQEYTVHHDGFKKWMAATGKKKIEDSPYHEATAKEIDWEASVELQAAAQHYIDHAISKTCNLPADVSKETVSSIYMKAYDSGCKGFTVYREGSRTGVLLDATVGGDSVSSGSDSKFVENRAPKRPQDLPCDIYHMTVKAEKWNLFVGLYDNRPYEVFAGRADFVDIPKTRKSGTIKKNGHYNLHIGEGENEIVIKDLSTVFDNPTESAFTRTVSLALRHGAPIQYAVEQIEKGTTKDNEMFSLAKSLVRVLKNYIKDGTKASSLKNCPQCGNKELAYQEGCISCISCGWSKCS